MSSYIGDILLSGGLVTEESLCANAEIEFVVIFGSQTTGDMRPASDLDIAVKFTDELSSHERFRKRCFLSGDLQREDGLRG